MILCWLWFLEALTPEKKLRFPTNVIQEFFQLMNSKFRHALQGWYSLLIIMGHRPLYSFCHAPCLCCIKIFGANYIMSLYGYQSMQQILIKVVGVLFRGWNMSLADTTFDATTIMWKWSFFLLRMWKNGFVLEIVCLYMLLVDVTYCTALFNDIAAFTLCNASTGFRKLSFGKNALRISDPIYY